MSRTKLLTPVSAFLRSNTFASTPYVFTISDSASQIHASPTYASLLAPHSSLEYTETFPTRGYEVVRKFMFYGRSLCSRSAEEVNAKARCWNCGAVPQTETFLSCESCRSVQPVEHSVDYFQIFGLEKKYDIKDVNLETKYKDWQKKLHPDLVHSKSEREREYAAEQSARVIDAYRTLTKPLSRAIYILRLEGVDVDEEETFSEPELLAEILEIREAVEEASDSQALTQIQSQMQEKLKHWSDLFTNAHERRDFDEARNAIRRMTYYERVNEQIVKRL